MAINRSLSASLRSTLLAASVFAGCGSSDPAPPDLATADLSMEASQDLATQDLATQAMVDLASAPDLGCVGDMGTFEVSCAMLQLGSSVYEPGSGRIVIGVPSEPALVSGSYFLEYYETQGGVPAENYFCASGSVQLEPGKVIIPVGADPTLVRRVRVSAIELVDVCGRTMRLNPLVGGVCQTVQFTSAGGPWTPACEKRGDAPCEALACE